jgi:hypothetical protein
MLLLAAALQEGTPATAAVSVGHPTWVMYLCMVPLCCLLLCLGLLGLLSQQQHLVVSLAWRMISALTMQY